MAPTFLKPQLFLGKVGNRWQPVHNELGEEIVEGVDLELLLSSSSKWLKWQAEFELDDKLLLLLLQLKIMNEDSTQTFF